MYKDKDKQRKAVRLATQRYRQRLKGITQTQGITVVDEQPDVIPKETIKKCAERAEPQSYNSMMVGYVPPVDIRQGYDQAMMEA